MTTITVNGELLTVAENLSAEELLELLAIQPKGVAIAVNASILPKSQWRDHHVQEGDHVEIVTAAAGG